MMLREEEPMMGGGWGRSGDGFTGGHGGTVGAKKKNHVYRSALLYTWLIYGYDIIESGASQRDVL
jgi:hypothetical protein